MRRIERSDFVFHEHKFCPEPTAERIATRHSHGLGEVSRMNGIKGLERKNPLRVETPSYQKARIDKLNQ